MYVACLSGMFVGLCGMYIYAVSVKYFPPSFRSILSGVLALAVLIHACVSIRSLCFFGHAVLFCVCVLVRSICVFGLAIVPLYVSVLFTVRFLLLSYSMSLSLSLIHI